MKAPTRTNFVFITIFIWALSLSFNVGAQIALVEDLPRNPHSLSAEDEKEEAEKIEKANLGKGDTSPVYFNKTFNTDLIPCSDIYDNSWDSMNVDVPEFKKTDVADCHEFALTDGAGCSYVH